MQFPAVTRTLAGLALAASCALAAACGNITTTPSSTTSGAASASGSGGPAASGTGGTATLPADTQYASDYVSTGSATIAAGKTLDIAVADFTFTPNTLTVAAGTAVTLQLDNTASDMHNFSLDAWNVSQNLQPGTTTTVTFTPTQAGTYYFYCNVPGHVQLHMVGKLIVQ